MSSDSECSTCGEPLATHDAVGCIVRHVPQGALPPCERCGRGLDCVCAGASRAWYAAGREARTRGLARGLAWQRRPEECRAWERGWDELPHEAIEPGCVTPHLSGAPEGAWICVSVVQTAGGRLLAWLSLSEGRLALTSARSTPFRVYPVVLELDWHAGGLRAYRAQVEAFTNAAREGAIG